MLSHLHAVHTSGPNFKVACGIGGCATTSRSFSALYSHMYRHHSEIIRKRKEPLADKTRSNDESDGRELHSESGLLVLWLLV